MECEGDQEWRPNPSFAAFKEHLKADTLMLGLALPDDNVHSPDEKFSLDAYMAGMKMAAHLWPELAGAGRS
jgi:acetylornithine deacetylase/succinyl-diaminopimelate desuccinylase-like protein